MGSNSLYYWPCHKEDLNDLVRVVSKALDTPHLLTDREAETRAEWVRIGTHVFLKEEQGSSLRDLLTNLGNYDSTDTDGQLSYVLRELLSNISRLQAQCGDYSVKGFWTWNERQEHGKKESETLKYLRNTINNLHIEVQDLRHQIRFSNNIKLTDTESEGDIDFTLPDPPPQHTHVDPPQANTPGTTLYDVRIPTRWETSN